MNTASTQAGGGGNLAERPPGLVGGHDSPEALTGGVVEPCDRHGESRRQFSFMPDTVSECFTRFHGLRILLWDGGVQDTGRAHASCGSQTTRRP